MTASELSTAWHVGSSRRRIAVLTALTLLASLGFAGLVLLLAFASIVPLLVWAVIVGVVWRPRVGLYVALGLVLMFEIGGLDPMMEPGYYFNFGLQHSLGLGGVIVSPLEMLLITILLTLVARAAMGDKLQFRGGTLGRPMLLFALTLMVGMVVGRVNGGDPHIAFWEIRSLLYLVVCFVLAANTIRTRSHVRMLLTIGLLTMSFYATEAAYRRVALIDTGLLGDDPVYWYSHESVVFVSSLVILILGQMVFGAPVWQRLVGPVILPIAVFTMMASERRAGQIALMVAFLAAALVFLFAHRKAFIFIVIPVLVVAAFYLPAFWNSSGVIGQPARAVRSIISPDPRDAASNMTREMEKINVYATIRAYPLLGVGFGRAFLQIVSLPDISFFPLWAHEPHHSIMWIWLKTGAIGFILFWTLLGTALARAARLAKSLREPELRSFALFALGGIVSVLVFCYVDIGMPLGRVQVFLGTLLGTLSVLDRIQREDGPEGAADAVRPPPRRPWPLPISRPGMTPSARHSG